MAYMLAWFGGMIGLHDLYLGNRQNAVIKLIIFIVSLVLAFVVIGILGFLALFIWVLIDIFSLADKVSAYNEYVKFKISKDIESL